MKKTTLGALSLLAVLIAATASIALASPPGPPAGSLSCRNLQTGETLSISMLTGHFRNLTASPPPPPHSVTTTTTSSSSTSVSSVTTSTSVTSSTNSPPPPPQKQTAAANISLQVTQKYFKGCTLSITGGSLALGRTMVTITGGTLVLNKGGNSGSGWGTTSGGSFLIQANGLRGNSTSARLGSVQLDLMQGSSEYLIQLHG